jgi:hypothetical protein
VSYDLTHVMSEEIERLRHHGDDAQAGAPNRWPSTLKDEFPDRLIQHDLMLVTREHGALAATGARLLDPWA